MTARFARSSRPCASSWRHACRHAAGSDSAAGTLSESVLQFPCLFEALQALAVQFDEEAFVLADGDEAGFGPARLTDVLAVGVEDLPLAALAQVAVVQRQGCGVQQGLI